MNVSNPEPAGRRVPLRSPQSRPTKHAQRTEATKGKLLAAAFEVFAKDGFEAARLESIAQEAGFTRGAFYAHYKSKEELFFALMEQQVERRLSKLEQSLKVAADEQERLRTVRKFYLEAVRNSKWAILALEFKLFALRNSKALSSLVDRQRRIKDGILARGSAPFPVAFRKISRGRKAAMEALVSALVVQSQFDPGSLPTKEAKQLLGCWFDVLVRA